MTVEDLIEKCDSHLMSILNENRDLSDEEWYRNLNECVSILRLAKKQLKHQSLKSWKPEPDYL